MDKKSFGQFIYVIVAMIVIGVVFTFLGKSQQMIVVAQGNSTKKPIELVAGKYQDSDCGMVIDSFEYASQVIHEDGKTWFFHDHGGMANWLKNKDFKDTAIIWVMTRDTKKYIDGRSAFYSRTDTTPMGYGFGAYEHSFDGAIDFVTMNRLMVRGEHFGNPKVRASLIGGVTQ